MLYNECFLDDEVKCASKRLKNNQYTLGNKEKSPRGRKYQLLYRSVSYNLAFVFYRVGGIKTSCCSWSNNDSAAVMWSSGCMMWRQHCSHFVLHCFKGRVAHFSVFCLALFLCYWIRHSGIITQTQTLISDSEIYETRSNLNIFNVKLELFCWGFGRLSVFMENVWQNGHITVRSGDMPAACELKRWGLSVRFSSTLPRIIGNIVGIFHPRKN